MKWVYKTKLKENGEVDKYKAQLVSKGYEQEYDIDYKEIFVPIVRHDIIRLVIMLATQKLMTYLLIIYKVNLLIWRLQGIGI